MTARGVLPRSLRASIRLAIVIGLSSCHDRGVATGVATAPTANENVHLVGRFTTEPAGPRFAYPGSAIATRFRGTGVDVTLEDTGHSHFDVVVDGGAPTLLVTGGGPTSFTLARDLPPGEHTLTLVKRTESFQGVVRFGGFRVTNGALLASPFPFTRKLELIGDSITCGYGDLGSSKDCGYAPETSNENVAWGALAARELGAVHTSIAYSGRAVFKNRDPGDRDELMDIVWLRTLPDDKASAWDFTRYVPDAVVINLGTNDFAHGDPGPEFVPAYAALVKSVRAKYGAARIVCAVGPMLEPSLHTVLARYVQSAIAAVHDPKVTFLDLPPQNRSTELGCNYHPNQASQAKMAAALVAHLRGTLGW
jgi:lysophospholipase L1-like esterase